jgi:Xaa-Pro aminopeptidase
MHPEHAIKSRTTTNNTETFEPNMVFAIEPNHLVPSVEKYHLEDLVLVTADGPRVLSNVTTWRHLLATG